MELSRHALPKALLSGAVAGAIAGGIAEAIYGTTGEVEYWRELLLRPLCWGIMGAMLGGRLSAVLPNLGFARGVMGGTLGGVFGGIGFLFTAILFPQFLGRMVGFGVLGAALGIALVAAEAVFREAILEVRWAPNETTSLTLGARPIYIGGGDDHVPIANLPEHASSISLENGRVLYSDLVSGKKTTLKDGSKIKIGNVELVIKARKASRTATEEEF
jgi:Ca-activated chloride channel family protein